MKRLPIKFKTSVEDTILCLDSVSDKLGNLSYLVTYHDNDGTQNYANFKHLSSALDFIQSNFK